MVAAWDLDPDTTEQRLNEAVRRLVEALQPECIYLFGSRARGDAGEDSDYDLMVVVEQAAVGPSNNAPAATNGDASGSPTSDLTRRAYESLYGVGIPIDVIVWSRDYFDWQLPAKASLAATVLREGRLLYAT